MKGCINAFLSNRKLHKKVGTKPPPHSNAYELNVMACGLEVQTGSEGPFFLVGSRLKLCKACFPTANHQARHGLDRKVTP